MTLQFKIQISHLSKPPVWRRVVVPAQFSFMKFHEVIQAAFGWGNYHLYEFSPAGFGSEPRISIPDPTGLDEGDVIESKKIKLSEIFDKEGQQYYYTYDFGDSWEHQIVVEKVLPEKTTKADCLDGKGACPPEDCGGPWGYEELKETLGDPNHPEYADMKEWLEMDEDEKWDPIAFDLAEAKKKVQSI